MKKFKEKGPRILFGQFLFLKVVLSGSFQFTCFHPKGNMFNLLLFITSLLMVVPWLILKLQSLVPNAQNEECFRKALGWFIGLGHGMLLNAIKATFVTTTFIGISANKVIAINNIQWFVIHLMWSKLGRGSPNSFYVLKQLVSQSHLDNVIGLMVKILQDFGRLRFKELGANLVNMGHYVGVACS